MVSMEAVHHDRQSRRVAHSHQRFRRRLTKLLIGVIEQRAQRRSRHPFARIGQGLDDLKADLCLGRLQRFQQGLNRDARPELSERSGCRCEQRSIPPPQHVDERLDRNLPPQHTNQGDCRLAQFLLRGTKRLQYRCDWRTPPERIQHSGTHHGIGISQMGEQALRLGILPDLC
jgi:hypothetical protein